MKEQYQQQLVKKKTKLSNYLEPFNAPALEVFESAPINYRMRAEFRIWHEDDDIYHIMFDQISKTRYKVEQLTIASKLMNQLMLEIIPLLKTDKELKYKLFQIDYLTATNNQALISLIYHKPLTQNWENKARTILQILRDKGYILDFIGVAKKQKIYLDKNYLDEELTVNEKKFTYRQIEGSFTQPNAQINQDMLAWAQNCVKNIYTNQQKDLLELYCGNGNFTIALAKYFRKVLATEISKPSVNAAIFNSQKNNIHNIAIARLSAEEFTTAINKTREFKRLVNANIQLDSYDFSTIFIDPPRMGLDNESVNLVKNYEYIIYISCNPETLRDNLAEITKTHTIIKCALFDQFPFTEHIETGVFLKKRI